MHVMFAMLMVISMPIIRGSSLEYLAHHDKLFRRNLQTEGYENVNRFMKEVSISLNSPLVMPSLLGNVPMINALSCIDMSVQQFTTTKTSQAMLLGVNGMTIACTAKISFTSSSGDARSLEVAFGATGNGFSLTTEFEATTDSSGSQSLHVSQCSMNLNPSLSLLNGKNDGFFQKILNGGINAVLRALGPAIGGVIGGLACSAIKSTGSLILMSNAAIQLQEYSVFIRNTNDLITDTKASWFDFSTHEHNKYLESTLYSAEKTATAEEPPLFDYSTSKIFKYSNEFLNTFLGASYGGLLAINTATTKIAKRLGDTTGNTIVLDDLLAALPPITLDLMGLAIEIQVTKASVQGLNTFTVFDIGRPDLKAKATLNNKIALDLLKIDLVLDIKVGPVATNAKVPLHSVFDLMNADFLVGQKSEDDGITSLWDLSDNGVLSAWTTLEVFSLDVTGLPSFTDTISISLDLEDLAIDAAVLIAINTEILKRIPIGGLANENILNTIQCLATTLYALELPVLGMSIKLATQFLSLGSYKLDVLMKFLAGAVNLLSGLLLDGKDIGGLVSGILQSIINGLLGRLVTNATVSQMCNNKELSYFVFTGIRDDGDLTKIFPIDLDYLLNEFFSPKGDLGLSRMATIAANLTSGKGDVLEYLVSFDGPLKEIGVNSNAVMEISILSRVANIGNISDDTKLLQSLTPLELNNKVKLGPIILTLEVDLSIGGELFKDGSALTSQFTINMNLGNVGTSSRSLFELDLKATENRTLGELPNKQCPLEGIKQFAVLDLDLSETFGDVSLEILCTGVCSTSLFDDLGQYLKNPEIIGQINSYTSQKVAPFFEKVFSDKATWDLFSEKLLEGPLGNCYHDGKISMANGSFGVIVGIGISFALLGGLLFFYKNQGSSSSSSMALHLKIPIAVKLLVPVGCVTGLVLFATGLVKLVETSVAVYLTYADGSTNKISPGVLPTSDSSVDGQTITGILVNGNAYLIAGSIAVLSGILPFVWVVYMLFAWVAKPNLLSPRRRGELLLLLSSIGKYTLFLPLFLAALDAGLHFTVELANNNATFLNVEIVVSPSIGLFLFSIGAFVSMVTNQVILHFHRAVLQHEGALISGKPSNSTNGYALKTTLKDHVFKTEVAMIRVSKIGQILMIALMVVSLLFLFIGIGQNSFSVVFGGSFGSFVDGLFSQGNSVLDVIQQVRNSIEASTDGISSVFFSFLAQVGLVLVLVFAPLMEVVLLSCLWILPLTLEMQKKLFRTAEFAHSASSIEVFVFTIIVMGLQLNTTLVQAILEQTQLVMLCGVGADGNVPLVVASNNGGISSGASFCIEMSVVFLGGFFILLLLVIAKSLLYQFTMRTCNVAIQDRELDRDGVCFQTDSLFDKNSSMSKFFASLLSIFKVLVQSVQTWERTQGSSSQQMPPGWSFTKDPVSSRNLYINRNQGVVSIASPEYL